MPAVGRLWPSDGDDDDDGDGDGDDEDDDDNDDDDVNKESSSSQPAALDKASTKISNRSRATEFHGQPDVRSAPCVNILSTFTQHRHKLHRFGWTPEGPIEDRDIWMKTVV